ncbi:MAG: AlpA family phage regulatory protein [Balneola sp.]|nr:AlpA family phage regulatory protein [Balneola sp.]
MKVIRPKQLAKILSISTVTLWRMEKRGELPPRKRISTRAVGWLESDIEEWLNSLQTSTVDNSEEV